ncbi:MAG: hypothetical protein ACRC8S_19745 [Fimbriiglobus sp.]
MTDTPLIRPVPRWLRNWSVVTLIIAAAVVILGSLITTFKVGMSDPVWPTEPWFLMVNRDVWYNEPAPGYLIEHTHRLVAWSIGVFAVVLTLGAWASERQKTLRYVGLGAVVFLLVAYLGLHGEMGMAARARKAGGGLQWPTMTTIPTLLGMITVLLACLWAARVRSVGTWVRVFSAIGLVAVMIQGLLGGYRVYLDQLMGTQLAAIHGSFGQVTLALLTAVTILAAPRKVGDALPESVRNKLSPWTIGLVAIVVMQLIWGVWVRHIGTPLSQRLHILTAFLVTAMILVLVFQILTNPSAKARFGGYAYHLLGILAVQVALGVEAYLGKFALVGPEAMLPPEMRSISTSGAVLRTLHTLIGAALLVSAVALVVRWHRRPVTTSDIEVTQPQTPREVATEAAVLV